MGKRGPSPQPTRLRVLRGNPGKRPINHNEPRPAATPTVPEPPEWLESYAKGKWREAAPPLHRMGLLSEVDLSFFAAYCQSYARWRAAEEWISENGGTIVLRDKDGNARSVVRAPQAITAQAALADMNRFGSQFGLSPSSRTNIQAAPLVEPENKFSLLEKKYPRRPRGTA